MPSPATSPPVNCDVILFLQIFLLYIYRAIGFVDTHFCILSIPVNSTRSQAEKLLLQSPSAPFVVLYTKFLLFAQMVHAPESKVQRNIPQPPFLETSLPFSVCIPVPTSLRSCNIIYPVTTEKEKKLLRGQLRIRDDFPMFWCLYHS